MNKLQTTKLQNNKVNSINNRVNSTKNGSYNTQIVINAKSQNGS